MLNGDPLALAVIAEVLDVLPRPIRMRVVLKGDKLLQGEESQNGMELVPDKDLHIGVSVLALAIDNVARMTNNFVCCN